MTRGLEGVDAVLEEGAANLEELKVIWGDPDESLDFDGFCARLSPWHRRHSTTWSQNVTECVVCLLYFAVCFLE